MPASAARIDANRRNALRSTGPRSAEGKARSRANGLKHGLTGAGVVMDDAARSAVDARKLRLLDELAPSSTLGELLVERIAVLSVRLERAARFDEASTSRRVRAAGDAFDDARAASIDLDARTLMSFSRGRPKLVEPPAGASSRSSHRRLCESSDGIDALIGLWRKVRAEVAACTPGRKEPMAPWSVDPDTFDYLCGTEPCPHAPSPARSMAARVIGGDLDARRDLLAWIDAAVDGLEARKAEVDPGRLALERREAADLALFDPSSEATLARKYEAGAQRELFRALAELRKAEAPVDATEDPVSDPLDVPRPAPREVSRPKSPRPSLSIADPDAPAFVDVAAFDPATDGESPPSGDPALEAPDAERARLIALESLGRDGLDADQILERELARVEAGLPILDPSLRG